MVILSKILLVYFRNLCFVRHTWSFRRIEIWYISATIWSRTFARSFSFVGYKMSGADITTRVVFRVEWARTNTEKKPNYSNLGVNLIYWLMNSPAGSHQHVCFNNVTLTCNNVKGLFFCKSEMGMFSELTIRITICGMKNEKYHDKNVPCSLLLFSRHRNRIKYWNSLNKT